MSWANPESEMDSPVVGSGYASTDLLLPAEIASQIACLSEITYPFDTCGLLIGRPIESTILVEQFTYGRNLESTSFQEPGIPRRFRLDPDDVETARHVAQNADLDIVGIWRSHPDTPARPNRSDLDSAWANTSYLIASVCALGCTELRSWRLSDDQFLEERLR